MGIIEINPYSIKDIQNGFLNVFNSQTYINMNQAFNAIKETSLQNWETKNQTILTNKIILLWSWDTLGTPVVWCNCTICKKEIRTRFWIYIQYQWTKILIDTNPDIKQQFLQNHLDFKDIDYIFITHTHTDHINGLWEFNFRKKIKLFHPNDEINTRNMKYFDYLEREGVIKKIPYINFETIKINEKIKVIPVTLNHWFPTSWFIIYLDSIKIGIMSDTNLQLDERTMQQYQDCDYLFIDGFSENLEQVQHLYEQIWEKHTQQEIQDMWYHTTIQEINEKKEKFHCKKIIIVHISHIAWSHHNLQKKYQDFIIGKDGLEFML